MSATTKRAAARDKATCPRCGAALEFANTGSIRPHHDPICGGGCAAAHRLPEEVRADQARLRRQFTEPIR